MQAAESSSPNDGIATTPVDQELSSPGLKVSDHESVLPSYLEVAAPNPSFIDVSVQVARESLWEEVYKALKQEQPELMTNFESVVKDDAEIAQDDNLFSAAAVGKVVALRQQRMENRQWTFMFFDKPHKIRDTIEGILSTLQTIAPVISAGMNGAPPYLSIPWTFVSMAIPVSSLTRFV